MSLATIEKLLAAVTETQRLNLGIEIHNWMAQVFFWNRYKVEQQIIKENKNWDLAQFSFTDYHGANHVGKGATAIEMAELTPHAFLEAIQKRRTTPFRKSMGKVSELLVSLATSAGVEFNTRSGKRYAPSK